MIIKKKIVKGIMYKPKMFINPNGKMVLKEKIVKMIIKSFFNKIQIFQKIR